MEVGVTLPATCEHIGEQLATQFAEENKSNRKMLIKILSCLQCDSKLYNPHEHLG